MTEELVLYESQDKISLVTLNRPQKLNALSRDMRTALSAALRRADEDGASSVVVLRGAGRAFCVGYDLGGSSGADETWRSDALKYHDRLNASLAMELVPWYMKKPVIASVQGYALGAGCEIAMFCDLTVAADDAKFGEPETRHAQAGPGFVMPWLIGYKKARELLYFGDMIDAKAALDLGMINRVVPAVELADATIKYARRLALIAPEALAATKLAINRGADAAGFRTALYAGLDVVGPLYATQTEFGAKFRDIVAREGVPAAVRWRAAQFRE